MKLEQQAELLSSDDITEEQLQEILKQVQEEEAEEDRKEAEHNEWLAKREAKILEIKKILTTTQPHRNKDRNYSDQSGMSGSTNQTSIFFFFKQSGSELDSADAGDSPMVTDHHDHESETPETPSTTSSVPVSLPPPVSSSSSSPVLLSLLHSPSKTTSFPTSPISHFPSSHYKTPTTGTNLMNKFSPTTTTSLSTTTTPLTTTDTNKMTVVSKDMKNDDDLEDINEIIKDKLSEVTVQKESEQEVEISKKEDEKMSDNLSEDDNVDVKKHVKTESDSTKPCKTVVSELSENVDPKSGVQCLDGVESVPVSPMTTPAGSRSMTPTPSTTTPPSATTSKSVSIEEDRDYRAWKKSINLVWNQISQHKNANLFANAVTESDAPDYRDIVLRPMDLNSIRRNVESGHIKTTDEFERDLMLMFFNATMYNSSDHEVYKLTKDMFEDTQKILRDYKNAQQIVQETEPKSLRGKSESAETTVTRPRGRSVSGSVGDQTPVSSRVTESRKRERSGSIMIEETMRSDKKRKV